MFWVPHVGIRQPARSCVALQLARPNRHDAFRVCVTLQQIERVELERSVEQEFDVVQQQQVASGMLIGQLTQNRRGLEMALFLRHACQTTAQLSPDMQWRDALALREGMQQCGLPRMGWPDEKDELALQRSDFIDQVLELFDHSQPLPVGNKHRAQRGNLVWQSTVASPAEISRGTRRSNVEIFVEELWVNRS